MLDSSKPLKIGIVAMEASGDLLGAELIKAFKDIYPQVEFVGIAGPKMLQEGCETLFPQETLSVMGIVDVLKKIPLLLKVRSELLDFFLENSIDAFIGIDAPDFNLTLEEKLKSKGVPTIHYVSPTVWAWRKGRIHKIKRACDLMLTLFPFEAAFYKENSHPVKYVGHPLADKISLDANKVSSSEKNLALLPGSRESEIKHMGPLFIEAAKLCWQKDKSLQFLIPMINPERKAQFKLLLDSLAPDLPCKLMDDPQEAFAFADVALVKSGTATLEALLMKCPMVVAYQTSPLNYFIGKCLVHVPFISLPNILARKSLVPEYIQHQATPKALSSALLEALENTAQIQRTREEFQGIHHQLKQNSSQQAAKALLEIISKHK